VLEREIKLRFPSVDEARAAILAAGASPLRARRLQSDTILDTPDESLRQQGQALRVRREGTHAILTLKGPVQPGVVKIREEHEVEVADAATLEVILSTLGLEPSWRYEKYREEWSAAGAVLAIDQTPIGTFVEIEGDEAAILALTSALGREHADAILDSYRTLFSRHCAQLGLPDGDMVFRHDSLTESNR